MFGERLKLARKRSGLSLRALSGAIGSRVSAQAIGKYERGEMMPGSDVLDLLAKALGVSPQYLMSQQVLELYDMEFRKLARASAKDRAAVEAAVIEQLQRYCTIERILRQANHGWQDPQLEKRFLGCLEEAELLALELRKEWQLGVGPIPNMTELLEERGIKVLLVDLPESISGLTCSVRQSHDTGRVSVIVVNTGHSLERRRQTLAHELGHLVLDPESPIDHEKAATRFAGSFLVTREHLQGQLGNHRKVLGYKELVDLKHRYRVSGAAMLVCLNWYGIINDHTLSYAFRTFARRWRVVEPEPVEPDELRGQFEMPRRFQRLCYWALAERYITPVKAMELLMEPLDRIEQAIKGPDIADADTSG